MWWDGLKEGLICFELEICGEGDVICECFFIIEYCFIMMILLDFVFVWLKNGSLYCFDDVDGKNLLFKNIIKNMIILDGVGLWMVIIVNGLFFGFFIVVYEG